MIITSNCGGPGQFPDRPFGTRLLASIDVEWQKNYRIKDGNRAFCYSIIWLAVPEHRATAGRIKMTYTSVYLEAGELPMQLVELADADLRAALNWADAIVGHQLCSDLAVLAANADRPAPHVALARELWHSRRAEPLVKRRIIDTRFDAGHLLSGHSRRLVDVCEELNLDVTQPELARKSMTALHRDWLERGDIEARERISVLNLRHSLSTAFVALRATGQLTWSRNVNVNRRLRRELHGTFDWLDDPILRRLA
jgi:hypothetical protein